MKKIWPYVWLAVQPVLLLYAGAAAVLLLFQWLL